MSDTKCDKSRVAKVNEKTECQEKHKEFASKILLQIMSKMLDFPKTV